MVLIRFEEADSADYTQIGEGLTRVARETGRLETGHELGKYVLRHDDGCTDCSRTVATGETFFIETTTGDLYCEPHGEACRAAE